MAVVLCAVAIPAGAGCGSGGGGPAREGPPEVTTGQATDVPEATTGPGAGGGPVGSCPGEPAPGAPITIPAFTILEGFPLPEMKAAIENHLRDDSEACGDGSLCVTVNYVLRSRNQGGCIIENTRPPAGATIRRGSTVTVTINCRRASVSPDHETTQEPTPVTTTEPATSGS
ncbi:hypothetical protein GCM10017788_02270 [Amycolatopsis acidiphila]|nr:hypothetical protein GCM10017788_02270 [Amycolatopsis acidiphila]